MASSVANNGEGRDVGSASAASSAHVTAPRADMGANEVEYESDVEENLSLALRRRNASDDEEDGEEERIAQVFADEESEDEGAAPPLEDEEEEEEDEEVEEEYEEDVVERIMVQGSEEEDGDAENAGDETEIHRPRHSGSGGGGHSPPKDDQGIVSPRNKDHQAEEEKKEAEPFAVPTAGAFYMHDDRFRDNGGARPRDRRSAGGRKLWEAKDDRAWVHDRFEELNLQDDISYHEGQRRGGRGRFRGRGRGRGGGRVQGRGNRPRIFEDSSAPSFMHRGGGRGRGLKRNEAEIKNTGDGLRTQNKQASKAADTISRSNVGEASLQPVNAQFDGVLPRKHVVVGSSLNSASPPFYPSSSNHQSFGMPVKREAQYGGGFGSIPSSSAVMAEEESNVSNASGTARNSKNTVAVRGQTQAHVEPSPRSNVGKQASNMQPQLSRSSSVNLAQQQQSKVQGKSPVVVGQPANQPTSSGHQINRGSNSTQTQPTVHQRMVQTQGQVGSRMSSQQTIQQGGGSSQSSPRPSTAEIGSASSPTGSNKSRNMGVGRGRGSVQGAGRGSYVYNGTQAVGGTSGMSVAHADQTFPHTPALLPVMQFGGQHHAGLGVPAVGMALPGYVAQPQLGFGNSEMTWVPVLAGAAGALGAAYCSPYIAVDSTYYAPPSVQPAPFSVAGRDSNGNKPSLWKPPPRAELVNDEFGQRQNKPRRYSEMNFGQ